MIPVSADTRGANVASVPLAEPTLTRHVFVLDAMAEAAVAADSDALP